MTSVIVVEFWRRTLDGREYNSNRLFSDELKAKQYLRMNHFRQVDELTFEKKNLRAIITERTIE